MAQDVVQKSMVLLPEYQERFLKDLLANVYQVDEDTGMISGFAAKSPLEGVPVVDAEGNPVYQRDAEGNIIYDQYGQPVQQYEGGVAAPDIIRMTEPQIRALRMMTGQYNPETGQYEGGGLDLYKPMMEQAKTSFGAGFGAFQRAIGGDQPMLDAQGNPLFLTADGRFTFDPTQAAVDSAGQPVQATQGGIGATTGAYDPTTYTSFYDPFVEDVIGAVESDLARQMDVERGRIGAQAVQAGAFGGSRQAVAEQELARNAAQQLAQTGAQLRSAAFTGAQQQAMQAFENQMQRGQTAAQIFGQLGQGIGSLGVQQGALGEAAQALSQKDINALFNVGALEQAQLQAEYDVGRQAQLEQAYEPFGRFAYMRDILTGLPGGQSTLAVAATPQANPIGNIFSFANTLSGGTGGGGLFGLGSLTNPSGAAGR